MDGWALTLCLCSYDARFSGGVQVVAHAGVLRFGYGVGVFCCGVPLLLAPPPPVTDTPPPVLLPLPPCLMGVPLFREGVGCLW